MIASSHGPRSISALAGVICALGLGAVGAAPAAAAETVVSLTFKDTLISQYAARQTLADHGMQGTFYVNSGLVLNRAVDVASRMSWRQINDLASDGNEIGGGGLTRTNLLGLTDPQLEAEICDDRDELARRGYAPVSFGYPFGTDHNATVEAKVEECGYASARAAGGVGSSGQPKAESIPPANPYATRTRGQIDENDTLADIQSWITQAESTGGGWVQLIIHNVCDACSPTRISPADLDALLDWLELREGQGTQVKTVREVITGTAQPEPPPFLDATVTLTFDDGLDDHYDIARPKLAAHGMQGTFYVNSGNVGEDTTRYMNWNEVRAMANAGQEIAGHTIDGDSIAGLPADELEEQVCDDRDEFIDQGLTGSRAPVSFAYPNGSFDAAAKAMVDQCGYSSGRWNQGLKWFTRSSRCQHLTCPFDEPIPPPDPYLLRAVGSIGTNDDVEELKRTVINLEDSGGGWAPLIFHEICPGPSPSESGCPDENSSTTPEILEDFLDWLEPREATHGTEVKTVKQVIQGPPEPREPVDTNDPVSQIKCDSVACSSGLYDHDVSVTLSATDAGGSGLKEIRYTTDGTVPTGSSPVSAGPILIDETTTIRFRASDNHGNVEQLRSQLVEIEQVDEAAPASSIACDGSPCIAGFYNDAVSVALSATDTGGSGVKEIRYTLDGSAPTGSSLLYTGAVPISSTTTIRFRAEDNAGNVESPANSQTIQIDTQAPTSSIACDGLSCQTGYNHAVSATLSAIDAGTSGVLNIRYTLDGSTPDGTSPVYSGPIPITSNTTIKFRSEDNAGNVESPIKSRTIAIDTAAPVSTIDCDGDPCIAGFYSTPVSATLDAVDTGGSGVKEIRFTTDGSAPAASSELYTGPIAVGSTTQIRFRAEDNLGNLEAPKSQIVQIQPPPAQPQPPAQPGDQGVAGAKQSKCKKPKRRGKRGRKKPACKKKKKKRR